MSLINQMLNDLDSRHAEAGQARVPNEVRPLPAERRGARWPLLAAIAGLLVLAAGAAWVWMARTAPAIPPPPVAAVAVPGTPGVAAAPNLPAQAPAPPPDAPGLPPLAAATVASPPAPPLPAEPPASPGAATVPAAPSPSAAAPGGSSAQSASRPTEPSLRLTRSVSLPSVVATSPVPAPAATPAAAPVAAPLSVAPAASPAGIEGNIAKQARTPTPRERSEAQYRAAIAHVNQGRGDEAVATLRATLHEDPGHVGARQLLLRLLLEARAHDELRAVLEAGLAQSPQQTSWALLLARLYADKGDNEAALKVLRGPALEPSVELRGASGAVLQRLGRHAEAEAQYAEALRLDGRDARWWVGLGIAAEAQGKPSREIFQRARETGGLPVELQGFVDQKLR